MAKPPTTQTLTASGSTDWHEAQGTIVHVQLSGTFGGGSVALEISDTAGNPIPLTDDAGDPIAITVATARNVEVPAQSKIRVTLSGATSPSLLASIKELSDGRIQH